MTRTQRILGLSGLCLLLSGWAGCYFNREGGDSIVATDDADGDGWTANIDCNDNDAGTFPGATEVCGDGVDNDCDNLIDFGDPDCQAGGTGGTSSQGGSGQGGDGQGGDGQGGSGQGGSGQGGSGQGGAGGGAGPGSGGSGTGGSGTGGSGTGGSGTGGSGTGGSGTGGSGTGGN